MVGLRRLAIPLLAGLLVAMCLGVGGAANEVQAAPRATIAKLMIPAAAFVSNADDFDYYNSGHYLGATPGFSGYMTALLFPEPVVYIRKITIYAYDNTGSGDACVTVYRSKPAAGEVYDWAGVACTADSTDDPQVVTTTAISPRKVITAAQGSYLYLSLYEGTKFYGVAVNYSY